MRAVSRVRSSGPGRHLARAAAAAGLHRVGDQVQDRPWRGFQQCRQIAFPLLQQSGRDGLVERTAYATIPPQVDYRLTATGQSLAGAVLGLADWAREHKDVIAASRQQWDAEHSDDRG